MSGSFEFTLNGKSVRVAGESTNTSLLTYLRANGHTGSKEGCAEGDCGACTVAIVERDAGGAPTYRAINSCIALLPMVAGREVVTVEGVGTREALHPVQSAMVKHYGSQCGYCTPGFVCAMFEGYYRKDLDAPWQVNDQLNGNLCRCTGYRPIRDAFVEARGAKATCGADAFAERLAGDVPALEGLDYTAPAAPGATGATGGTFHRPTTLAELLALRQAMPGAELICGATEIGVYINKQGRRYAALIATDGVPELMRITRTETALVVGGSASLTALEESLAGEFPSIQKMLLVFASRPIRNRASLAGNLVTASPIGDMAPVLMSLDASVRLVSAQGERVVALADFFTAYRKTVLAPDEVLLEVILPRPRPVEGQRRVDSYKVSKRRELDISIVAAGFAVEVDAAGVVTHARLAYGGVAATPVRAKKTEAFLVGKAWDAATVEAAKAVLADEFAPIEDVRSGVAYRRGLIVSLFDKFWLGEVSAAQDGELDFAGSEALEEAVGDRASFALKHESAIGHVTGTAIYVDDQARRRVMLEMWPVLSKHAHARIDKIDTAVAAAMPGIACVLTAADVPGENDVGAIRKDEPLLASGEVHYHGQVIAVVVGESLEACKAAAKAVEVTYTPLPAILTIGQAIEAGSYHTDPHTIRRGDCTAALAASPHTLSGELHVGGQEHFYLESHAAWAECGDDDDVFVCASTQHPSEIQAVVSHVLHLPRNKVVVEAPRMGGGFGGKETQGNGWAALVALAATRTRQPVRVQLDRDVDMTVTGKRHPFFGRFEVGFDDEGRLSAAKVELVSDGGWALDLSESILDRALFHLDNGYYIPAVAFQGRVGRTNNVSHTAFRGFGGPQGMVVIEEVLDRVARRLGLAPEVVRERNLYRGDGASNTTHYGQPLGDNRLPMMWEMLMREARVAERRAELALWNAQHAHVKRGIAVTPVKFGISFTASFLNQAGALVLIYRDGTVQVNHGGTEMGQGLSTKMRGVAMRELGLSMASVRVMKTRTDKVPNTSATAASSGADLNGAAVKNACDQLRERLAVVAAEMLAAKVGGAVDPAALVFADERIGLGGVAGTTVSFAEVVDKAYMKQVSLSASGFYRTPGLAYDKAKGHGIPFYYYAYGVAVCEVEVDALSGMKRVTRVDILQDVGTSLNANVDRGQIEGAFVQGMGWLTGEELKWDKTGRLLSHSASTYQIPSIGDAPAEFNVRLLPKAAQPGVIHGSKAVGEPPLMLAISVREAIRDAVAQFAAGTVTVPLACPATHEAIYASIQAVRAVASEATVGALR
ncbi:MAG: xanthine dehydrogenase molybdopterin binding subunit [Deltaproteobacteria bacterium]|nr:xanthine dehydrogenase molybdopterin binding subunit [Deltaproteobacteria bacterium]